MAEVQADEADVQFFHSAIAKKWGLCLWDKDCPEGEACAKHHCEVRSSGVFFICLEIHCSGRRLPQRLPMP